MGSTKHKKTYEVSREGFITGKPIKNVNIEHNQSLSPLDKFAVWITDQVGSMGFFIIIFISQLARVLKIKNRLCRII